MDTQALGTFVEQVVDAATAVVGGTAHVAAVQIVPPPKPGDSVVDQHVAASYTAISPQGGVINWQAQRAQVIEDFLTGRYRRAPEQIQLRFLQQVRQELSILFHETLHSIGVADYGTFRRKFFENLQHPGMRAALEGSNQLITQAFLPELITQLGLDRVDPRITQVPTPDVGAYPGQVAAMYQIYGSIAHATGHSMRDVLKTAAQYESGADVLAALVDAALSSQGRVHDRQGVSQVMRVILKELDTCQDEFYSSLQDRSMSIRDLERSGAAHGRRAVEALAQVLQGPVRERTLKPVTYRPLSPMVRRSGGPAYACGVSL